MKRRLAYWLARLYPAAWRARYGDEFDALVEDSRPGWHGLADIARGGMAMQLQMGFTPVRGALWFGLAALVLAIPGSLLIRDSFISMAALRAPAGDVREAITATQQEVLGREPLSAMIDRHKLYPDIQDRSVRMERLQRNIKVTGLTRLRGGTSAFRVGFEYADAAKAQAVTQELMTTFIDTYRRQNTSGPGLDVLDTASLPRQPVYPNRPVMIAMFLLAGAMIGALVAMVRRGGSGRMLRAAMIGAVVGAGVVALLLAVGRQRTTQRVDALLEVKGGPEDSAFRDALARARKIVLSDESLTAIIERHHVGPLSVLRQNLAVWNDEPGGRLRLMYVHGDADKARTVLREVMTSLLDEYARQRGTVPARLEVLQMPVVYDPPLLTARPSILALGPLLGAVLAAFAAGLRYPRTNGVRGGPQVAA
jgi:hypothetical protein